MTLSSTSANKSANWMRCGVAREIMGCSWRASGRVRWPPYARKTARGSPYPSCGANMFLCIRTMRVTAGASGWSSRESPMTPRLPKTRFCCVYVRPPLGRWAAPTGMSLVNVRTLHSSNKPWNIILSASSSGLITAPFREHGDNGRRNSRGPSARST